MKHSTGQFVGTGRVVLFRQAWLPDESRSPCLVLVHGFGEHSGRFGPLIEALLPAGYPVFTFDLRGHGRSPGPRGHIQSWGEYREDVARFLDLVREEQEAKSVFLFGHSMGGLIALEFAISRPGAIQGLVASAPLLEKPRISRLRLWLGGCMSRVWPRFSLSARIDPKTLTRDRGEQEEYEEDPLVHGTGSARLSTELQITVDWVQRHASQLTVPTLICHGGGDRLVPPQGSRTFARSAAGPDLTYREYPEACHELHRDMARQLFFDDLLEWLERHSPSRAAIRA